MKALTPGYKYELANHVRKDHEGQTVRFVENSTRSDGTFDLVSDGTTNEELLEVLLDRLNFQNKKLPSREAALAITHIENGYLWLKRRTELRKERGVENTAKP